MKKELREYLPDVLMKTSEFPILCAAEQPEIDALHTAANDVLDAQFVDTAGEMAIKRYEAIYKIVPKGTATTDERRFAVQAIMNAQLPFTARMLNSQLETLCGADGYKLVIDHVSCTLSVKVDLIAKNNFDSVTEMLERIVPLNMEVSCALLYNQHSTLAQFTHAQLASYTHTQLREEAMP